MELVKADAGITLTHVLGVPVYAAKWRLLYGVEGDLGKDMVDVPRNALFPDGVQ